MFTLPACVMAAQPCAEARLARRCRWRGGADPNEFAEVIRAERDFYRAAAAAAGIKME